MSDELILLVDGTPHRGWKGLTVSRSIERGPNDFEVSMTDRWDAKTTATPKTIRAGMPVQVYINDDLICNGYIDDVDPQYGETEHSLGVRGRSKIGDLVDCSTEGTQFPRMSLFGIANQLCAPFGIKVSASAGANTAAKQVFNKPQSLDLGQPIWEFLEDLARVRALLLTSTPEGNLLLTRAGAGTADMTLELGKNIKSGSANFSSRELFSDYIVTAQQPKTPLIGPEDTSQPKGSAKGAGRYRPYVISADSGGDIADCRTRAEWQRNVHFGRSQSVVYTITGWRQTDAGRLWIPNELVPVKDAWSGIDKELLIVETRLRLSEEGRTTEIRVMPREAFDLLPLPEPESGGDSWL